MKIDTTMPEDERKRWHAVRLDSLSDLPGLLVSADEQTGDATMKDKAGEQKTYNLGAHSLRLVRR